MKRKIVLTLLVCVCGFLLVPTARAQEQKEQVVREVAVTFDDLPFISPVPIDDARRRELTRELLNAVTAARIPAIGFVNERQLHPEGVRSESRVAVLKLWTDAGLELGNHTYAHPNLHTTPLAEFQQNVIRGETVTRELLRTRGKQLRYFRHPFLHTGRDLKTKTDFESFLRSRNYTIAPVTIDNSDWIFAKAYGLAKGRGDRALAERIAQSFIPYMEDYFAYYEQQSVQLFNREIKHVLLLHANELNADTFPALAAMMQKRGYRFITLERALTDAAYRSPDTFTGVGGISWIHRWALTAGKGTDFFRGEPRTPEFVMREADMKVE
jgi:peptidoglycan/xylan/chitin deacetylase (PgdA/CDA1 family)